MPFPTTEGIVRVFGSGKVRARKAGRKGGEKREKMKQEASVSIYIYIYMCVCVCVYVSLNLSCFFFSSRIFCRKGRERE